ncbi:MAG TPA: lipoprotein [Steroidobacteraceae bacterium]|nr:lipoprotein [Steroidobacteraceae bacterium]
MSRRRLLSCSRSGSRPALVLASALGVTLLLGACGQKGPLYLPDQQKTTVKKGIPLPGETKEEKNRSKDESKAP